MQIPKPHHLTKTQTNANRKSIQHKIQAIRPIHQNPTTCVNKQTQQVSHHAQINNNKKYNLPKHNKITTIPVP